MIKHAVVIVVLLTAAALTAPSTARAQGQIASIVSAYGGVEVQRGGKGEWQPAPLGSSIFTTDAVRTSAGAFAKLIFVDDAVVDLGPSTQVSIEHYGGARGTPRSLLRLTQGKVEALVSGYASEEARYEIETPTAVVRAQSAAFIVNYDAAEKATDVTGVEGNVSVRGTTGIIGPGVAVGPNEATHVPRDGFPSPIKALDPTQVREAAHGLRLVGTGTDDSLSVDNPISSGRVVAASDRPTAAAAAPVTTREEYLRPGVPGFTLLYSLSPDIRANNQPLPVYRAVPPNQSPNPPH